MRTRSMLHWSGAHCVAPRSTYSQWSLRSILIPFLRIREFSLRRM